MQTTCCCARAGLGRHFRVAVVPVLVALGASPAAALTNITTCPFTANIPGATYEEKKRTRLQRCSGNESRRWRRIWSATASLMVGCATAASAATFVVRNTNDSGAGSLRQAILDANAATGPEFQDLIRFDLPAGGRTIRPTSALPAITGPVDLSGTTPLQGEVANPPVELDGSIAGTTAAGLTVTGRFVTIRGMVINRFAFDGIAIRGATAMYNEVRDNFIGTDVTGRFPLGNGWAENTGSPGVRIGIGAATGNLVENNVLSGNVDEGVSIDNSAFGNTVRHNLIGTDPTGKIAVGNLGRGLIVQGGAHDNRIEGNVISANQGDGIMLFNTRGNTVVGNIIGTDKDRQAPLPNRESGIAVWHGAGDVATDNLVGGTLPGAGNLIAFNGRDGVWLMGNNCLRNPIIGNAIFGNTRLGINLVGGNQNGSGVTANDPGDGDSGPNNQQNYPELTAVFSAGGVTRVEGTLNSTPRTTFALEVFRNRAASASTFGEGQWLLARASVTTDDSGVARFSILVDYVAPGAVVTATATDPAGNTSEFSAAMTAR